VESLPKKGKYVSWEKRGGRPGHFRERMAIDPIEEGKELNNFIEE